MATQPARKMMRQAKFGDDIAPSVSPGGHVRWWMKYHRRTQSAPVKIKNPEKYLSAHARRRLSKGTV